MAWSASAGFMCWVVLNWPGLSGPSIEPPRVDPHIDRIRVSLPRRILDPRPRVMVNLTARPLTIRVLRFASCACLESTTRAWPVSFRPVPLRQRRKRDECWTLWYHSCLLRAATNLAADRHRQLVRTLERLGLRSIPDDSDELTKLQVETAEEIGGIRTRMLLDASEEIEKYHWGPLQIALCLLAGVLAKYEVLCKEDRSFQDDAIDAYCHQHAGFVKGLHDLRNSLLHQRYDNMPTQVEFLKKFGSRQGSRIVDLLLEGLSVYEPYVKRMGQSLKG